jgi:hypothetical protein
LGGINGRPFSCGGRTFVSAKALVAPALLPVNSTLLPAATLIHRGDTDKIKFFSMDLRG